MLDFLSQVLSFAAVVISLGGLIYTVQQVRLLKGQLQVDIKGRIAATNRELLTLAFDNPELFNLFEDRPIENKTKRRHYIQMWVNHIHLMWEAREQRLVSDAEWYSDMKDIADFFTIAAVSKHWSEVKTYYPPGFVQFVLSIQGKSAVKPSGS